MLPPVPAGARMLRTGVAASMAAGLGAALGEPALWLCLPLALVLAGAEPSARAGLAVGALVVVAAVLGGAASAPGAALSGLLSLVLVTGMRIRLERERDAMRRSALRDPLTGLANRRALGDRLTHEVARHLRQRERFAILALDLDGFKAVNDRFGHDTGDELLREVAAALRGAVRGQDTVARLGGDEFCIVAPQTDEAGAAHLTERVLSALGGIAHGLSGFGASVGAAVFPEDGCEPTELLAAADAAAIEAKRRRGAERARLAA